MVRIAAERIADLFARAAKEATGDSPQLADRYVTLARRIGMRYNVRMPSGSSEWFCRGCSTYWVEGRTVRTRLRSGRRVRTCLRCGRERRVSYRGTRRTLPPKGTTGPPIEGLRERGRAAHSPGSSQDRTRVGVDGE